jgi:hypothetical protein
VFQRGSEIIMSDASGKWQPMETDNATTHRCMQQQQKRDKEELTLLKTPQNDNLAVQHTNEERIAALENRIAIIESWIKRLSESAAMYL